MGAIGSVVGIVFGVFWTIMAFAITQNAPFPLVHIFFPLFGVVFIGIGVLNLIYNATNATSKNRMSAFDITDAGEEPDPIDGLVRGNRPENRGTPNGPNHFCPFCGAGLNDQFKFCPNCGKNLGA